MASTILPKRHLKEFSKLDNIVHMCHSMIIKYIKCNYYYTFKLHRYLLMRRHGHQSKESAGEEGKRHLIAKHKAIIGSQSL